MLATVLLVLAVRQLLLSHFVLLRDGGVPSLLQCWVEQRKQQEEEEH